MELVTSFAGPLQPFGLLEREGIIWRAARKVSMGVNAPIIRAIPGAVDGGSAFCVGVCKFAVVEKGAELLALRVMNEPRCAQMGNAMNDK